jgi:hypothetical protein
LVNDFPLVQEVVMDGQARRIMADVGAVLKERATLAKEAQRQSRAEVWMETGLDRTETLDRMARRVEACIVSGSILSYDTWEITDHPAPDGSTFTLYAVSVVWRQEG